MPTSELGSFHRHSGATYESVGLPWTRHEGPRGAPQTCGSGSGDAVVKVTKTTICGTDLQVALSRTSVYTGARLISTWSGSGRRTSPSRANPVSSRATIDRVKVSIHSLSQSRRSCRHWRGRSRVGAD